MTNITN